MERLFLDFNHEFTANLKLDTFNSITARYLISEDYWVLIFTKNLTRKTDFLYYFISVDYQIKWKIKLLLIR